jgi:hypothetical protein
VSALAILALVQAVTLSGRLQGGVTVTPDTVRIGDPFTVSVRVRAPSGAAIEFPPAPDSGGPVEPLDPVQIVTAADSAAIDQTASTASRRGASGHSRCRSVTCLSGRTSATGAWK